MFVALNRAITFRGVTDIIFHSLGHHSLVHLYNNGFLIILLEVVILNKIKTFRPPFLTAPRRESIVSIRCFSTSTSILAIESKPNADHQNIVLGIDNLQNAFRILVFKHGGNEIKTNMVLG